MRTWWARHREIMSARARRRIALDYAQINLDLWVDYGNPTDLEAAIQKLRAAS